MVANKLYQQAIVKSVKSIEHPPKTERLIQDTVAPTIAPKKAAKMSLFIVLEYDSLCVIISFFKKKKKNRI